MGKIEKIKSEITAYTALRLTIDEDDYKALKHLAKRGWMTTRLEFGDDNEIRVHIAIGKVIRQGRILIPADLNFDVIDDDLIEVEVETEVDGTGDGADNSDGNGMDG